jgi:hypothetical protein
MSEREEDEALVAEWLGERGYKAERPTWLPRGRNPDWWATAREIVPAAIWVEVKSIDEEGGTAALSRYHGIISAAQIPPGLHGHATVNIESHAIEQSVRWALKEFARRAPKYAGQKVTLAFVQQTRDGRQVRRAEVAASEKEIVWVRGEASGAMCPPINVCKESFAETKVLYPGGEERAGKTFDFFDWNASMECSLVAHLDPDASPLDSFASMSSGDSSRRERVLRAVEDANGQLRKACETSAASGIVAIVMRGPFAEDFPIQTACYGHLMVPITLQKDGTVTHGDQRHDHNERKAAFRADKNRHVSAVVHVRRGSVATFFPNPFAHRPIGDTAPLFAAAERADVEFV